MTTRIDSKLCILCAFVITIVAVESTYINYNVQYYCDENPDRRILISNDGNYSAIILHSSSGQTAPNQSCHAKIVGENIAGMAVMVKNVSLSNSSANGKDCSEYIRIANNSKWCTESDAKDVISFSNELDISFVTGLNSSAHFEFVVTTFSGLWNKSCVNANHIRCHGGHQICIYEGLECDGVVNCPSGSDEHECPTKQDSSPQDSPTIVGQTNQNISIATHYDVLNETEKSEIISNTLEAMQKSNVSENEDTNATITSTVSINGTESTSLSSTVNDTSTTVSAKSTTTPKSTSTSTPTKTESTTASQSSTTRTTSKSVSTATLPHPSTTKESDHHHVSGGMTAVLIIIIISLFVIIIGSIVYLYKKQNESHSPLYSPL